MLDNMCYLIKNNIKLKNKQKYKGTKSNLYKKKLLRTI